MSRKSTVDTSTKCDYKTLCSVLRETLSNLHYETSECEACGWVASADANWMSCTKCGRLFCEECAVGATADADDDQGSICEECSQELAVSEKPIEVGDLVEMMGGLYKAARFTVVELGALLSHGPSGSTEWAPLSELKKAKETQEEYDASVRAKLGGGSA